LRQSISVNRNKIASKDPIATVTRKDPTVIVLINLIGMNIDRNSAYIHVMHDWTSLGNPLYRFAL
jgi:hypothetical protein